MASKRPKGYFQSIVNAGVVDGDEVELSDESWTRLCVKYAPKRGLGDWVAILAGPVGRWIKLKRCGCAERQAWLNGAGRALQEALKALSARLKRG